MTRAERNRIIKQQRAAIAKAWADANADIRSSVSISDLEAAIAANDFARVQTIIGVSEAAYGGYIAAIGAAYAVGGASTARQIGRIPSAPTPDAPRVAFRFNASAPRAEQWIATNSGQFITGDIIPDQLDAIRARMAAGLQAGRNPRSVALDLVGRVDPRNGRRAGGVIGLTGQQEQWVRNAREQLQSLDPAYLTRSLRDPRLDAQFRRAIRDGKPLTASQIDRAITNLEARTFRYRGETIARTESLEALRAGQHESVSQSLEEAGLDPHTQARKRWSASGGERTRDDHADMDGQTVPYDEPFTAPDGSQLMFPGDTSLGAAAEQTINCRCAEEIDVDYIDKALQLEGF